jgi:PTS system mannitol-specific IIC component
VIAGTDIPMFLGAMMMGPLGGWVMKKVDAIWDGKVRPGFEMLIDNFSAGIVGLILAAFGFFGIGPIVSSFSHGAGKVVDFLVGHDLLPLTSIFIEPAKVLFLNNAINHGVLGPLGVAESADTGKSILFMLETNPGPGFGILLAYLLFGPRSLRPSVPAAMAIQFLGGIHEIYFPYVLMKPSMVLAAIAGGGAGIVTFMATGAGLVATPSPGSIFAYLAETPRGGFVGVLAGVVIAAGVSFTVGSLLLGFGRLARDEEGL